MFTAHLLKARSWLVIYIAHMQCMDKLFLRSIALLPYCMMNVL
jgi:hypothetical protein